MNANNNLKSQKWTEEDVLVMLCALNSNIEKIRGEFEADKRDGISFATEILSRAIGNGCTPARVKGKMEHLWREGGPSGGRLSKPIDPLYRSGAWTRTLPSLNALYPDILSKIALAGIAQESIKLHKSTRPVRINDLRRREKDENNDPIDCRCGFAHFASACVHCRVCQTWQHIWCYYDSDSLDAAADDHTCDQCKKNDLDVTPTTDEEHTFLNDDDDSEPSESLISALERLQLESLKNSVVMSKKGTRGAKYAKGVSQSRQNSAPSMLDEEELLYGPQDEDVQSVVKTTTSLIKTIAYSLGTDYFKFEMPPSEVLEDSLDLAEILQGSAFSNWEHQADSSPVDDVSFLRMAIGSAIWNWTFYASVREVHTAKIQSRHEALFTMYREIPLSPYEIQILRNIHRKAWTQLTVERADLLKPVIFKEADRLARRLLDLLSSMICRTPDSGDTRPLETAEDWIKNTKHGKSRFRLIVELFVSCIKLKDRLPVSGYYYEVFYPTSVDRRFMEACPEEPNDGIKLCYSPAILQYEPRMFQGKENGSTALFSDQSFIRATSAQRADSIVVCPATVVFI